MRRSVLTVLVSSLAVVAACSGDTEPADPPTPTDSLTTVTASPPDTDTDTATETAPSSTTESPTESPSESSTEPSTEPPTTSEAGGVPTMPEEAKEDTEAGAEAFALHYIDLINYTGMNPETGVLEPLAADGCKSCENHEASVAYGVENGDYLLNETFEVRDTVALFDASSSTATVRASIHHQHRVTTSTQRRSIGDWRLPLQRWSFGFSGIKGGKSKRSRLTKHHERQGVDDCSRVGGVGASPRCSAMWWHLM